MWRKCLLTVGVVCVVIGLVGFLASAVMLASATDVIGVRAPPGAAPRFTGG